MFAESPWEKRTWTQRIDFQYHKFIFFRIYIPVDTCCHYQFCFALQMRHSCISLEQKQNLP